MHDFLAHRAGNAERHANHRQLRVDRLHNKIAAVRAAAAERMARHQHARGGVFGRVLREDRVDAVVEAFVDGADAHRLGNRLQIRDQIGGSARAAQAVGFEIANMADEEFVVGVEELQGERGALLLQVLLRVE